MSNPFTEESLKQVLPRKLNSCVTSELVDKLNNISTDQYYAEEVRNNFISYIGILNDGKFKTTDYLNAITYVSNKLRGKSNIDSYKATFPDRYRTFVANGTSDVDIASYISSYNKNKLVNLILEQTLVPTWVLNQDLHQKAINHLAHLMINARSEKVQADSANSLLVHLSKPKEVGPLINIDMRENTGLTELQNAIGELAKKQLEAIKNGTLVSDIAESKIIEQEPVYASR